MGWSDKYKKSIDCDNPKGFSQRAHCQGRKKKMNEERGGSLHHWFKGSKSKEGKPGWVQADGSPCANEPGETKTPKCFSSARLASLKRKGKKGESIIRSAVRRKREKDPGQQAKSGGAKPTLVKTFSKGKEDPNYIKPEPGLKEEMEINEAQRDIKGKGSGKKDACYHKVKSIYDVWPSAYASGALVKCRKVGADNWGTKSEETMVDEAKKCWPGYEKKGTKKMFGKTYNNCVKVKEEMEMKRYCPKCEKFETRDECRYGPKYWDMFSIPEPLAPNQKKYNIATVHPGNFPESYDHEHSMVRSQLSTIVSAAKRLRKKMKGEGNVEAWVQSKITKASDYLDSAADYVDSGEMKAEQKTFSEFMIEAVDKSKMKCNKPKAQAHGSGETGKSHIVKACEGGEEKIIRFGQLGVKGSPKKKGESKAYASRRHRFKTRHAKNISKGKMSAAYWANKVKW